MLCPGCGNDVETHALYRDGLCPFALHEEDVTAIVESASVDHGLMARPFIPPDALLGYDTSPVPVVDYRGPAKRGRGRPIGACVVLRPCPLGCGASLGCNAMRKHVPLCRKAQLRQKWQNEWEIERMEMARQ